MKKIILSMLIAVSCTFSSLAAFSWSGLVDNNTKLSADNDFKLSALKQSNGIYLAVNSHLNDSGNLRFAAEGLYKYTLTSVFDPDDTDFKNIADCDLLKFAGDWALESGTLSLSLGRFKYSDYSGVVFSQTSDGAYINYDSLPVRVSLYAGFTGLLNRLNVSMIENEVKEDDQFYALCPKYIPVTADFAYKQLFGNNTLGLQGAFFIPATDDYDMKAYGTLILNGYFGTAGTYDARFTMGTEKFDGVMIDAKLDTNFFAGQYAMLTIGGEYISGAQGDIKPFMTLTTRTIGNTPYYNGLIIPKVAVMFAADKIYASVTERIIVAMPEDEGKLDGFDTAVNIVYNLFSDVQLGCNIGAYICKETKEFSNYSATIKASLAF